MHDGSTVVGSAVLIGSREVECAAGLVQECVLCGAGCFRLGWRFSRGVRVKPTIPPYLVSNSLRYTESFLEIEGEAHR